VRLIVGHQYANLRFLVLDCLPLQPLL
jgi:hypothetical protein